MSILCKNYFLFLTEIDVHVRGYFLSVLTARYSMTFPTYLQKNHHILKIFLHQKQKFNF